MYRSAKKFPSHKIHLKPQYPLIILSSVCTHCRKNLLTKKRELLHGDQALDALGSPIVIRPAPTVSLSTIHGWAEPSLWTSMSVRVITMRLAERQLLSWRPLRILLFAPPNHHLRLKWCQAGSDWTAAEWNKVVFSNESRFSLSSDENRVHVWSPRSERLNPARCTAARHSYS
ncbi:transposable element Tcb2 transposase [Trichonephila clavipes]|nr:transposable element Tcb2 transposase [Trichonephila clavipes]